MSITDYGFPCGWMMVERVEHDDGQDVVEIRTDHVRLQVQASTGGRTLSVHFLEPETFLELGP